MPLLSSRSTRRTPSRYLPTVFASHTLQGVGTVVSGTTLAGTIRVNDTLLLGPDANGVFVPVAIKGIHRRRLPTREVRGGQTASFSLKKIKRSQIRKGMVMVDPSLKPRASWEFDGDLLVLHHPTTISAKYQVIEPRFLHL